MKITEVKTYTVGERGRNFLFCKVFTDEGIYGLGEATAIPSIQTEIHHKASVLIGEDPFNIERCWSKMFLQTHGMTGIVGGGAMSAIEIALHDLKGKAFGMPVWQLLGGRMRERLRVYTHATSGHTWTERDDRPEEVVIAEKARAFVDEGYTALKMGGIQHIVRDITAVREEIGDDIDIAVDLHGMPWMTTRDAISMGRRLEEFGLLFYEEPVAPENVEALARVSDAVDIPFAAGERVAYIYGARELIEREIVDVIQPDAGRFGGFAQMKKLAGMAEAHYIQVAPHDGSLGPVGEIASLHFCATIPNFLIWEHLTGDVQCRYEIMAPQPEVVDGYMALPDGPGLGVDLVDDAVERYATELTAYAGYAQDNTYNAQYIFARHPRAAWLNPPTE